MVIAVTPPLQTPRLLRGRAPDRDFGFEHTVHLFMGVVVDRATAHELHPNPQSPPPQAQPREAPRTIAKKRCTPITPDDARSSMATEQPLTDPAHVPFIAWGQRPG